MHLPDRTGGLNNAARHAQARNVQVTVRDEPERIHVTIQDDGGGFDPRRVRGLGLLGMQERVRHLGGRFLVDSSPGRGAVVTVEYPELFCRGGTRCRPFAYSWLTTTASCAKDCACCWTARTNSRWWATPPTAREAVEMAEKHDPDVVIMDLAMPGLNGIEATRRIIARSPRTAVVILSMHSDESYILRSLKAGARGYLLKDSLKADLIDAVRAAVRGKSFFSPKVSQVLKEEYVNELEAQRRRRYAGICSPIASARSCNWWPREIPIRRSPRC